MDVLMGDGGTTKTRRESTIYSTVFCTIGQKYSIGQHGKELVFEGYPRSKTNTDTINRASSSTFLKSCILWSSSY